MIIHVCFMFIQFKPICILVLKMKRADRVKKKKFVRNLERYVAGPPLLAKGSPGACARISVCMAQRNQP